MSHEYQASAEAVSESFPKIGEKMFANMIQIRLGQIAYEATYGQKPDMKNGEVRNTVGIEWARQYAGPFEKYLKNHPLETLDINDEEALFRLFEKLTPEEESVL
jgi:hypothetical protein